MREAHRLRERIQLSLDDRQVAALAVGALLLLAGMFALGLLVGMQLARRSPQPAPLGDLAALDAQRSQMQRSAAAAPGEPKAQVPAAHVDAPAKREMPAPPATVSVVPTQTVTVPPPEIESPLPPPPARLGAYTVQLGASQHRAEALQLASRAEAAGLKPYVVEARLPLKNGIWYRVRVGAFSDKASAERYRRDVDRELRTAAAVMPTR
jgi:DedD protein